MHKRVGQAAGFCSNFRQIGWLSHLHLVDPSIKWPECYGFWTYEIRLFSRLSSLRRFTSRTPIPPYYAIHPYNDCSHTLCLQHSTSQPMHKIVDICLQVATKAPSIFACSGDKAKQHNLQIAYVLMYFT